MIKMQMRINTISLFNFILLISILYPNGVAGQDLTGKFGNFSFFDNREFYNPYTYPQTIFGTRVFGQAGIRFDKQNEFAVGADVLYEFGSKPKSIFFFPIAYYHFENKPINLLFGAFHRKNVIELPDVLLSDTMQYYRPTVEGIFVEFRKSWGYQSGWIDWTSRQSPEAREIFLVGGTGRANFANFFYRHDFIMTHYAHTLSGDPFEHIRDNGGFLAVLGMDHSGYLSLDTLTISTGFSFSYDRYRNVYPIEYYGGSWSQFNISYKGIGIRNTLYFGDGQVQMVGDGFYRAEFYNRSDIYWEAFRKGRVRGMVEFSFHFLQSSIDYSQLFSIYVDFESSHSLKATKNQAY